MWTTKLTRGLRVTRALIATVRDPNDLDRVFQLADSVGDDPEAEAEARQVPAIDRFLDAPFRQGTVDLERCRRCAPGTLGAEVARLLDGIEGDPEVLDRPMQGHGLAWVQRHVEETHDIWHAVTGFGTTVPAEAGLQAFYAAQLQAPPAMFILIAAMVRITTRERELLVPLMDAVTTGWRNGRQARALFGVDWRDWLDRPLSEVRRTFEVTPARGEAARLHTEPSWIQESRAA